MRLERVDEYTNKGVPRRQGRGGGGANNSEWFAGVRALSVSPSAQSPHTLIAKNCICARNMLTRENLNTRMTAIAVRPLISCSQLPPAITYTHSKLEASVAENVAIVIAVRPLSESADNVAIVVV